MHGQTEYNTFIDSPLGTIGIAGSDSAIHSIFFEKGAVKKADQNLPEVFHICKSQLSEYFEGKRKVFELPLQLSGTAFQQTVWTILQDIPFGSTISYSELAIRVGDVKTVRAVGAANGKNPIAIIIPCHRVIGMDHKLVGYAGGLRRKQWLLEHEEKYARGILRLFDI